MAEPFEHFEVNRSPRWPVLLRLWVASLALHLTAVGAVLYVPAVREAVNITALLAETSFVDKAYEKTQIGDDVRIVQLEKFRYPDGYFAIAGEAVPEPSPTPLPWVNDVVSRAEAPPPSPIPSPSPSATEVAASEQPQPSPGASANAEATVTPTNAEQDKAQATAAQEQLEQTAAAHGVDLPVDNEINRQPLRDLASYANDLKKDGKLDLEQNFEVTVVAELDKDAKLKDPVFTQKSGDPSLIDLAGKMIAALNDSRILVLLKALNDGKPTRVAFVIRQDQNELVARIESEVSSEESARQKASVFNLMLAAGEKARKGKDEAILMRNTEASSDGKKVIFNFSMPRQAVSDMIKKQIALNTQTKPA